MKALMLIILLCTVVFNLCIATEVSNQSVVTTDKGHYGNEINKLSLEFVMASEQIKGLESNKNIGQYTSLKTSLMYSLTENDEFRLFNSYVIEDYTDYKDSKYFELLELMYRRKSILNHNDHGFNLDFEMKHANVIDKEIKKLWGFSSESIPQLILKKKFSDGMGVELKARHHFYHRNSLKSYSVTNEDRFYLSFYKMFEHTIILNTEFKYRHKFYTGPHYSYEYGKFIGSSHEDLVVHPAIMYLFSRKVLLEGYIESKLNDSTDNKSMGKIFKDQLLFGGALYLTAF